MGRGVRFIILNDDERFGAELRGLLTRFDGVKIVAEVDQPALLRQTVENIPAEVLLVHLDPNPDLVLPVAGDIAADLPHLPVFAVSESTDGQLILNAMRKGVREFLTKPIDTDTFAEALDKIASGTGPAAPQGKLVTVLGASGGAGATMLATNLACELAELNGGRVSLIDLDYRFGQVATFLDLEPTYTLADLCGSVEQTDQQMIERALVKHDCGVRVLSRPATFTQAESITAADCVGVLSTLTQISDYVVVDGPIRFDPHAQSVLDLADANLLIVQLLVPSVRNAVRILDGMREAGYNLERTKLVCNRVGKESSHLSPRDVMGTVNFRSCSIVPDDWEAVGGAINLGMPLSAHCPKNKVRLAIRELAEQLHSPQEEVDDKNGAKKGLMGRIFAQ